MNPSAVELLLVEDNPDDVALTLRALKKHNFLNKVHVVRDGAAALEFIFKDNGQPKVIILDLKLPKVSGLEVLRRLKSEERTKAVPVVVLTSSHEEQDLVESYRLGVNSYIVKPVDFDQFVASVAELGMHWLLLNKPPA